MALVAWSCTPSHESTSTQAMQAMESRFDSLSEVVATLKETSDINETLRGLEGVAYLTPSSQGYDVVESGIGRLTVALKDVEPYANGTRIRLSFGNPTMATIDGLNAKIDWGSVDEKGSPRNESAKSKDVTLTETLRPGAWTQATVVLDGIKPGDLGFVRLHDVTHRAIRLLR